MDPPCVRIIKRPQSGRGLGHVTKFRNLWTPLITFERIDIRFKFVIDIEDAPLLRPDHKKIPKWAWPRSRTKFRNFGAPYNFGTNRDICFKFGTDRDAR